MKFLVTGSNGFIGSAIVAQALAVGHEAAGMARSATPLVPLTTYYSSDLSVAALSYAIREFGPDAIIHAAGAASVAASFSAPLDDMQGGLRPWSHVLEAVRTSDVRPHVVFLSSAAVYGNSSECALVESQAPSPISPYGYHKVLCELLAQEYAACFSVSISVARLFSVFGPRQRRLLVWDIFRKATGQPGLFQFDGTGEEKRDFLCVTDVASGLLALAEQKPTEGVATFNLARGESTSVRAMAESVSQHAGQARQPTFSGKVRVGDPAVLAADVACLHGHLPEWRPRPLADSLADCVQIWASDKSLSPLS